MTDGSKTLYPLQLVAWGILTYRLCKTFLHKLISIIFCNFCRIVIFTTKCQEFHTFILFLFFHLKLQNFKTCPDVIHFFSYSYSVLGVCVQLSIFILKLARKRPFLCISMKSRLVRAARETLKFSKLAPR